MHVGGDRPLSRARRHARLFHGPLARLLGFALGFPLRSNTRCLFSSTEASFLIVSTHLLHVKESHLLGSGSRFFFASALCSLLDRKTGRLFRPMARVAGVAQSLRMMSCEAVLQIRSTKSVLARPNTHGLVRRSLAGHLVSTSPGAVGAVPARYLGVSRPPECTHNDEQDRQCERETDPTDDQKHLQDRRLSSLR